MSSVLRSETESYILQLASHIITSHIPILTNTPIVPPRSTFHILLIPNLNTEELNTSLVTLLMNQMSHGPRNSKRDVGMTMIKRNRCLTNPWCFKSVVLLLGLFCATGKALLIPQKAGASFPVSTERRAFQNLWQQLQQQEEKADPNEVAIPYIIDRLSDRTPDHVFDDVARMCINVFFNKARNSPPYVAT